MITPAHKVTVAGISRVLWLTRPPPRGEILCSSASRIKLRPACGAGVMRLGALQGATARGAAKAPLRSGVAASPFVSKPKRACVWSRTVGRGCAQTPSNSAARECIFASIPGSCSGLLRAWYFPLSIPPYVRLKSSLSACAAFSDSLAAERWVATTRWLWGRILAELFPILIPLSPPEPLSLVRRQPGCGPFSS